MEGYVFSLGQYLASAAVGATAVTLAVYLIGRFPNYSDVFPAALVVFAGVGLCYLILLPPGSDNALRWKAEAQLLKEQIDEVHMARIEIDRARERAHERAIRERMQQIKHHR